MAREKQTIRRGQKKKTNKQSDEGKNTIRQGQKKQTVRRGQKKREQTNNQARANQPMKILCLAAGISPQGALHNLCHTDCTVHPHTCNNGHRGILEKITQAFLELPVPPQYAVLYASLMSFLDAVASVALKLSVSE